MAEMGLRQEPTNYTIELIDKTRYIFVIDDVSAVFGIVTITYANSPENQKNI